jgi:hypothetical protein
MSGLPNQIWKLQSKLMVYQLAFEQSGPAQAILKMFGIEKH